MKEQASCTEYIIRNSESGTVAESNGEGLHEQARL